jgi:glycosyltransferase involved in cell wall biosynthesis
MNNKIVVHLVEALGIGGIERLVATVATGLPVDKYQVQVWCAISGGSIADDLRAKGIEVRILGITSYYNPLSFLRLARMLRLVRPDIVHTHTYFVNTLGRIAAKLAGIPVILTHVHSTYWTYSKRNLFIEKILSRVTDRIICCSNAVKEFVVSHEGVETEKTITIYNGVQVRPGPLDRSAIRIKLGLDSTDFVIVTIGSLFAHKGHKYFIEALTRVKKNQRSIKYLIVGDGPLRETLHAYVRDSGLEHAVRFIGEKKDIGEFLVSADIYVQPSCAREGLGMSILEAMAYGKPVIATTIGGIPEAVDNGVTGLLVPPGDSAALAEALGVLLHDNSKRENLGREGAGRFALKFSADTFLHEIDSLYVDCLEQTKNHSRGKAIS